MEKAIVHYEIHDSAQAKETVHQCVFAIAQVLGYDEFALLLVKQLCQVVEGGEGNLHQDSDC